MQTWFAIAAPRARAVARVHALCCVRCCLHIASSLLLSDTCTSGEPRAVAWQRFMVRGQGAGQQPDRRRCKGSAAKFVAGFRRCFAFRRSIPPVALLAPGFHAASVSTSSCARGVNRARHAPSCGRLRAGNARAAYALSVAEVCRHRTCSADAHGQEHTALGRWPMYARLLCCVANVAFSRPWCTRSRWLSSYHPRLP